jgi:CheY-like chemotaxis protein
LDLASLSVLVVDDQPFFRVLLTEVLRNMGVRTVSVAVDGEDGLDAYETIRPDILITDWVMPNMDGIALTKAVRAMSDPRYAAVPIILVTANNKKSQIEIARNAGVDEFILKPISIKSVCDRMREVIERPRPFVSSLNYKGPCRRRKQDAAFQGPFRRLEDPIEVASDAEVDEGLRSVMLMAAARIAVLMKGLASGKMGNLRPIRMAVGEVHSIAQEIGDLHIERVCSLLMSYMASVGASDRVRPDVIQTHLNAVDVLLKTSMDHIAIRNEVVSGLERVVRKTTQAA